WGFAIVKNFFGRVAAWLRGCEKTGKRDIALFSLEESTMSLSSFRRVYTPDKLRPVCHDWPLVQQRPGRSLSPGLCSYRCSSTMNDVLDCSANSTRRSDDVFR